MTTPSDTSGPLLLQLRSDRRLGHEWDDWDGMPLSGGGVFTSGPGLFFRVALAAGILLAAFVAAGIWAVAPRLDNVWSPLSSSLLGVTGALALGWLVWLGSVAAILGKGRNWLPFPLGERGLLARAMPMLERVGSLFGISRDRLGNSMLRVFNGLAAARASIGLAPHELLILLPRCLGKGAMQSALDVSSRYGVPLFVASRGRYARQMIAEKRPKAVVAVACERDLVSGVHDVARHLPVLGSTLSLGDGPCRNTNFEVRELEGQVRRMLGLEGVLPPWGSNGG